MKIKRYSCTCFEGEMEEDTNGEYVRLSEIEPLIRQAIDNAKDSGLFAGSLIAEENAEELWKARELLRSVLELLNENAKAIGVCECMTAESFCIYCRMVSLVKHIEDHWRPIGPMPEVNRPPCEPCGFRVKTCATCGASSFCDHFKTRLDVSACWRKESNP